MMKIIIVFSLGTADILLLKEWVPENAAAYAGSCIAVIVTAVLVQALKAWRVMLESRWASLRRVQCCNAACGNTSDNSKIDNDSAYAAGSSDGEVAEAITGLRGSSSHQRSKCGWCSNALSIIIPEKAQFKRNIIRSAFTGVIVFLDYMLMLIVMSFNIGIILSAVGGFAIGALLFGHMGERSGGIGAVAVGDVAPATENDLEVHFVEPQSCCNTHTV